MTGLGVVGGALAGGYVGRSMEGCPAAQRSTPQARQAARPGTVTPSRATAETRTCRAVSSQAVIEGRTQPVEGIACLDPDGVWRTASGPAAEHAASADLVLRTQQRLHDEGYYVRNNIDGKWGPATSSAVRTFQRANGLAQNGQIDPPTRTALGLDPPPLDPAAQAPQAGQPPQPAPAPLAAAPTQ
jgi:hypothetical protein